MIVLVASKTAGETSSEIKVISGATVTLVATSGIASGEDTLIEIETDADGWTVIPSVLTDVAPVLSLSGPIVFRVEKPTSVLAYAVELAE